MPASFVIAASTPPERIFSTNSEPTAQASASVLQNLLIFLPANDARTSTFQGDAGRAG